MRTFAALILTGALAGASSGPDGFVGVLLAPERADLGFEVGGRLAAVLVRTGDAVRAGDVLAGLDERDFELREELASAERARAEADLARARSELRLAEEAHARRRQAPEVFSEEQIAVAREQERIAAFAVERGEAELRRALTSIELARRDRARTRLVAPRDGVVVARLAEPGGHVPPGAPVVRVAGAAPELVRFAVPTAERGRVEVGTTLVVDLGPSTVRAAVVRRAPEIDRPSGTWFVEAALEPGMAATGELWAGRAVRVRRAE